MLKEKLIKIGAKVVSHSRYVALQIAQMRVGGLPSCEIVAISSTELRPRMARGQYPETE